jgi:hypothetical protein
MGFQRRTNGNNTTRIGKIFAAINIVLIFFKRKQEQELRDD